MKQRTVIFFFTFLSNIAYSGYDSLFVTISGDTATVWNTKIMSNCISKFAIDVTIGTDSITIIERDTVGPLADCTCIFDVNVRLKNVRGFRTVMVYRQQLKKYFYQTDTTILIGSVNFTITGTNVLPYFAIGNSQSKCGGVPVDVKRIKEPTKEVDLNANYPNPFNPATTISFRLPSKEFVTLTVYDCLGRESAILLHEEQSAGYHSVQWDASLVASGVYVYRLQAGSFTGTKKMMMIR